MLTERIERVGGTDLTDPLDCHVYLLDGGGELALVDAGGGRAPAAILDRVRAAGFDPAAIGHLLLTHGHGDHAAGAAGLAERLPGLRVHASPAVAGWLTAGDEAAVSVDVARRAGLYPPGFAYPACPAEGDLVDGARIRVGDLELAVLDTPGHSAGHVALLLELGGRRDLLAGDAVFAGGRIALQPLPDCDLAAQVATLRRLRPLALDGLFAGHGEPVVRDGAAHVERANAALDRLLLPDPLNPAFG